MIARLTDLVLNIDEVVMLSIVSGIWPLVDGLPPVPHEAADSRCGVPLVLLNIDSRAGPESLMHNIPLKEVLVSCVQMFNFTTRT